MWICLGCALTAHQWERVWKRGAEGRVGSSWTADGSWGRSSFGPSSARQIDHAMTTRAEARRFWTELRVDQREAEEHSSSLHRD